MLGLRKVSVRVARSFLLPTLLILAPEAGRAQSPCQNSREHPEGWRCENGFAVGPENTVLQLPIADADPEPLYKAGLVSAGREDWRGAILYFTAAHHRAHLVPRYIYNVGLAHARAGNEAVAITWLAAYLVALPQAPNREEVWSLVRELNERSQAKVGDLWQRAEQAAELIPSAGESRYLAYVHLTRQAARSGDLARARRYFTRAQAVSTGDRGSAKGLDVMLARLRLPGALADDNLPEVKRLVKVLGGPPSDVNQRADYDRLLHGQSTLRLPASALSPFSIGTGAECTCPVLDAIWEGVSSAITQVTSQNLKSADPATRLTALALDSATPRDVILARLRELRVQDRERAAAQVSEALLLSNNQNPAILPVLSIAETSVSTIISEYDRGTGIWSARAHGLSQSGASHYLNPYAIRTMLAGLSRQLETERPRIYITTREIPALSWTPAAYWAQVRFDPFALLAEYRIWQGNRSPVVENRMDTFRRLRLYESARLRPFFHRSNRDPVDLIATTLTTASGGNSEVAQRRGAIEQMLLAAYMADGAADDLAKWLGYFPHGSPNHVVIGLGIAAKDIHRTLYRARNAFARTGRTWES